jgi:WhiB family redox-sensing transcriptional regulator
MCKGGVVIDISLPNAPIFADAQCAGFPFPDLFFPESQEQTKDVRPMIKKTCNLCVHRSECLAFAVDNNIKEGIWGGLTPDERRQLKASTKPNTTQIKGTK